MTKEIDPVIDTVLEAFRSQGHREEPVAGWLAPALSDRGALSLEVTFDMQVQDPATLLYVDLITAAGDRRAHLSIRVAARCVVLNMLEQGVWKTAVAANINFDRLRHWRLWLVVEATGSFSVRLGDVTLCKYVADFLPGDVAKVASNVSARCALAPSAAPSAAPGAAPNTNAPNPDVQPGACGVLDRDAPLGSTVLIYAPQLEADPSGLKLYLGGAAIGILETATLNLAGQRWFACLLDEKLILGQPRSQFLRAVMPGPDGAVEFEIFDVRAHPIVEITGADIILRSAGRVPPDEVFWRCPLTGRQTAVRLVAASADRGAIDMRFVRFVTPLSEILRLVPAFAKRTLAVLEVPDLPVRLYHLAIGVQLYTALEAFVRKTAEAITGGITGAATGAIAGAITEATPGAGLPVSAELQMMFLDWWSVLHLPEAATRVARLAPGLYRFLQSQRQFVGEVMQSDPGPDMPTEEPTEEPGAETIPLWHAMRAANDLFANPALSSAVLQRQVLTLSGLLRPLERHVFLLEISSQLLRRGHGAILNSEMPEDFLAEMLAPDRAIWWLSSVMAPLAARGRFADCVAVLERLAALAGNDFNGVAIAAAVEAANATRLGRRLKPRMAQAFMAFLASLGSRHYAPFRHRGLIRALIGTALAAAEDADGEQDKLLAFIEAEYATVPEFWTEFAVVRQTAPDSVFPASVFLDRLANLAATATKANAGLQSFRAFDANAGAQPAPMQVVASGERQNHLTTFLRLHGLSGPLQWGAAPSAALCEDPFLRARASFRGRGGRSGANGRSAAASDARCGARAAKLSTAGAWQPVGNRGAGAFGRGL